MRKFVYQLYNDYRCAVVVSSNLVDARFRADFQNPGHGWEKSAVVQIAETAPNRTSMVLAMDEK
jgi:hypothetical protein